MNPSVGQTSRAEPRRGGEGFTKACRASLGRQDHAVIGVSMGLLARTSPAGGHSGQLAAGTPRSFQFRLAKSAIRRFRACLLTRRRADTAEQRV